MYGRFLYNQLFVTVPVPSTSFADQTVIITGANVGLGLEAARHITSLGAAKVILAVRNLAAGREAQQSIEASTGRSGVCEVWELDLASYASVLDFGRRAAELPRLDAVVENAALATQKYERAEGHERTITVNVISTVLLGLLLLPKLRETTQKHHPGQKPRLSVVVSEVHAWTPFPEQRSDRIFEALDDEAHARMHERYPTSKLVVILALREMVRQLRDDAVVINMINPGFCHSQLTREVSGIGIKAFKMALARSTEEGSRTLVAGAAAGPESHGQYMDCGVADSAGFSSFVRSDDGKKVQEHIWRELSEILEEIQPGVTSNL
ncbi:hypothetical protein FE257_001005 [Aspergillus nanangensis]|uniref:Short-chain dehydrogenase/reductase family protein n=1 Tax=Aspergillus nanangensis TaxID=2582783 RepID=A0AAD4GYG6_ASPNN|nr:hypothetical protein FE257_001005 [Aspergillus nanangensis]